MELGIQHLVLDSLFCQKPAELLGSLYGNRTYQYRLPLGMGLLHSFHNGVKLLFPGLVNGILQVLSRNRLIGRNLDDIHAINITEFPLLCTGHTCFLFKFIKEVLERNRCKGFALTLHLYMLFCLNCLVQAVRITSSRHDTSGKLVHDQHLLILYHIILIPEHQVIGPKG